MSNVCNSTAGLFFYVDNHRIYAVLQCYSATRGVGGVKEKLTHNVHGNTFIRNNHTVFFED